MADMHSLPKYGLRLASVSDAILIKTDSSGYIQWTQVDGASDVDVGWGLVQTKDGGYAMSGIQTPLGLVEQHGWLHQNRC